MPMSQAMELMTSRSTVECYSPEAITERLPRALGGPVELDPASCATANRTVRAARYYTKDDDGYMRDWRAVVWLNPRNCGKICLCHTNYGVAAASSSNQHQQPISGRDQAGRGGSTRRVLSATENYESSGNGLHEPRAALTRSGQASSDAESWLSKVAGNVRAAEGLSLLQTYTLLATLVHEPALAPGAVTATVHMLGLSSRDDALILWSASGCLPKRSGTASPSGDEPPSDGSPWLTTSSGVSEPTTAPLCGLPPTGMIASGPGVSAAPTVDTSASSRKTTSSQSAILPHPAPSQATLFPHAEPAIAPSATDHPTSGAPTPESSRASSPTSQGYLCTGECIPVYYPSRLYLNPPFDDTPRWVKRWAAAYAAGEVGATVLLVNSAPGYEWWHDLIERAPVVLLRRRLSFLREDGTPYPDHHKKGQTVAYLGPDIRAFLAAYGALGRALLPQPHLAELIGRLETLQTALIDAQRALPAKGADRAYGALGRASDVAGLAVWSAMKHGGAMELWEERAA